MLSDLEDDAADVTEAVLIVGAGERIRVARQYVIEVREPERDVVIDADVNAAANRHSERMLRAARGYRAAAEREWLLNNFHVVI